MAQAATSLDFIHNLIIQYPFSKTTVLDYRYRGQMYGLGTSMGGASQMGGMETSFSSRDYLVHQTKFTETNLH